VSFGKPIVGLPGARAVRIVAAGKPDKPVIGFRVVSEDEDDEDFEEAESEEQMQVGEGHHEHTPDFVACALELRAAGARYVKMGECEVTFDKQRKGK
jgi:hypothetical protein